MNNASSSLMVVLCLCAAQAVAQTSPATNTVAGAVPHATVPFRISDPGTKLPDITWGLDLAWISEGNLRRGMNFAGADLIDIVRLSFQPSASVAEGSLSEDQLKALKTRTDLVLRWAPQASINLNSDPQDGKQVDNWYRTSNSTTNGKRWAQLIALTKDYVEGRGLTVSSVSPFNEPDYSNWNQGSKADFRAVCVALRQNADFDNIKLCGGNTLNNDEAYNWYNYSKQYLDEGNTHQLAGSFDTFADFYKTVVADGKVGVGDELHNTMECMVGSEYGLTKGIWWGTCDHTRSQFMKASRGTRLGYAEHRSNWTAASVYRHPDGTVQGFGGTSERQAATTNYRFAALDHDVFYNGIGPTREYLMTLPGGTGYQNGQTNAETLVNIQDGEDVMPVMPTEPTTYKLVNRFSGKVLSISNGKLVQTNNSNTDKNMQWIFRPIGSRFGGDFSYYKIMNARDTTVLMDVRDWSLSEGAELLAYKGGFGDNEQWFLEYAGDGCFYIRSKHSAMCIQVKPGTDSEMKSAGRALCQGVKADLDIQKWRLLGVKTIYNVKAPAAPTNLRATAQPASVCLQWKAPSDNDLSHYVVLRSSDNKTWNTIYNLLEDTLFTDNTVEEGNTYYYKVKAVDKSLNRSEDSEIISAAPSDAHALICHIPADSLLDASGNGNHMALRGDFVKEVGKVDSALVLDGRSKFLQLPATIANHSELTITAWVYWRGGNNWQRILDFGTDTDHYVFFTPSNGNSVASLGIKNGDSEQTISIRKKFPSNRWCHLAITFDDTAIRFYFDGELAGESTTIRTRPKDFQPIFNYIGRSQFSADPMLYASIDDVQIYNYALSVTDIEHLMTNGQLLSPGDVNGDGNVDLTDAIMIVYHALGQTQADFIQEVADVNEDGNIDLTDAIIVVYKSLGAQ